MSQRARTTYLRLGAVFPEILLLVVAADALRARVAGDKERGDAVQWVILAAIGAALAITVGTIVFNKIRDKANTITTTTPN